LNGQNFGERSWGRGRGWGWGERWCVMSNIALLSEEKNCGYGNAGGSLLLLMIEEVKEESAF